MWVYFLFFGANLRQNLVNSDPKNCLIWQSEMRKKIDLKQRSLCLLCTKKKAGLSMYTVTNNLKIFSFGLCVCKVDLDPVWNLSCPKIFFFWKSKTRSLEMWRIASITRSEVLSKIKIKIPWTRLKVFSQMKKKGVGTRVRESLEKWELNNTYTQKCVVDMGF
jgi:hypothetical protein